MIAAVEDGQALLRGGVDAADLHEQSLEVAVLVAGVPTAAVPFDSKLTTMSHSAPIVQEAGGDS